jgi:hypothetical protein
MASVALFSPYDRSKIAFGSAFFFRHMIHDQYSQSPMASMWAITASRNRRSPV